MTPEAAEARSELMTAAHRQGVRAQNWAAVEASFDTALEVGMKAEDARDHALRLMKQIVGGNDDQR